MRSRGPGPAAAKSQLGRRSKKFIHKTPRASPLCLLRAVVARGGRAGAARPILQPLPPASGVVGGDMALRVLFISARASASLSPFWAVHLPCSEALLVRYGFAAGFERIWGSDLLGFVRTNLGIGSAERVLGIGSAERVVSSRPVSRVSLSRVSRVPAFGA